MHRQLLFYRDGRLRSCSREHLPPSVEVDVRVSASNAVSLIWFLSDPTFDIADRYLSAALGTSPKLLEGGRLCLEAGSVV